MKVSKSIDQICFFQQCAKTGSFLDCKGGLLALLHSFASVTVKNSMGYIEISTNDKSFLGEFLFCFQYVFVECGIILLHSVIQSFELSPRSWYINVDQDKLIKFQSNYSTLFWVFWNVNVLEHLDCWIFREYGNSRITERIFWEVPIRKVLKKLERLLVKRFLI